MKTYKVITIKQEITQSIEKVAAKVESILNEKTSAGWELVDISWGPYTSVGGLTAFLVFKY